MDFGDLKMYIGGKLVNSINKSTQKIICPADESEIANIAWANSQDAESALNAAVIGFKTWSALTLDERNKWMNKLRNAILKNEELLRMAIIYEMGKTYDASYEDIEALINSLEFYPKAMKDHFNEKNIDDRENTHTHLMVSSPVGVSVAYLAWNFPLLNIAFKIGPALASGCSIIIKPSELSPVSAYLLGKIIYDINFPSGVINILCGNPEEVATTLSKSTIPRLVTMIGSTNTGKKVISDSSSSIKKLSMELGGNAPFIVFDDADFDSALDLAIGIKFGNSGQICVAANRFFIHEKIYNQIADGFIKRAKKLKLGNGLDEQTTMGPLSNDRRLSAMQDFVDDAIKKGANILTGGRRHGNSGYFWEPTVIENISSDSDMLNTEIFGPIIPLIKYKDINEAISESNKLNYGLASYVYTENNNLQQKLAKEIDAGGVSINSAAPMFHDIAYGGLKESGIGYEGGQEAIDSYLHKKNINIQN